MGSEGQRVKRKKASPPREDARGDSSKQPTQKLIPNGLQPTPKRYPADITMTKNEDLQETTKRLQAHPLYESIRSPEALCLFVENHVFAVWDFMTLLKSLQRDLTTVSIPWVPVKDATTARLINEIVLAEESDTIETAEGSYFSSHFEWYREGMSEIGANRSAIDAWIERIEGGESLDEAIANTHLPEAVRHFLENTASTLKEPIAVRAAVFHHAREAIIPEMFLPIASELRNQGLPSDTLIAYLQRHVEIDKDEHSVASQQMVERLLGGNTQLTESAEKASVLALRTRINLWDAILEQIDRPGRGGR